MKCPACKTVDLVLETDAFEPATHRCAACRGRWLTFNDHLAWLQTNPSMEPRSNREAGAAAGTRAPITEAPAKARMCPKCGKLLIRYRVSSDHEFQVDRCGACSGIWFDRGEWEAIGAISPIARVQHLFNDTHQHKIAAELRRQLHEHRCRAIVGDEAFEKARAFKHWMEQHPRQDALRAYMDDVHDDRPLN